jgi:nascent polypeptide-associated complex subunit beta
MAGGNDAAKQKAARAKLKAKFGKNGARTGGKGSARRKKKVLHKTTTTDDKRLQNTLKRLGVNNIPAIEEVNLFQKSGTVIHFNNPKVQASITANTYVISGRAEVKELKDLLPGIINQLGPDNLANLKRIAENMKDSPAAVDEEDSDDDIPELETNFEDVSNVDLEDDLS